MKKTYLEFYYPSEQEFKDIWKEGFLVLDANVLLDLYRIPTEEASKLLAILEKVKQKLWLPYQVGLEFSQDRLRVISFQTRPYDSIVSTLRKSEEKIKELLDKYPDSLYLDCEEIKKKIKKSTDGLISHIESKRPQWKAEDKILQRVDTIFQGRIGKPFPEKKLKELYKEGEERYKKRIPPGFMDVSKRQKTQEVENREYGDLIVWYQMIEHSKNIKKPLIFITNEQKEDWWWKEDGHVIGPHPELRKEMQEKAGTAFWMYPVDRFIEQAGKMLNIKIDPELVKKIRELVEAGIRRHEMLPEETAEREEAKELIPGTVVESDEELGEDIGKTKKE